MIRNVGGKMKTQAGQSGSHKKKIRAEIQYLPTTFSGCVLCYTQYLKEVKLAQVTLTSGKYEK